MQCVFVLTQIQLSLVGGAFVDSNRRELSYIIIILIWSGGGLFKKS